jgi:hypothetical protein
MHGPWTTGSPKGSRLALIANGISLRGQYLREQAHTKSPAPDMAAAKIPCGFPLHHIGVVKPSLVSFSNKTNSYCFLVSTCKKRIKRLSNERKSGLLTGKNYWSRNDGLQEFLVKTVSDFSPAPEGEEPPAKRLGFPALPRTTQH